jgi:hypothetical protein
MAEIAPSTNSLPEATFDYFEDVWMLAIGYSTFHCVMIADVAGRNVEAAVAFVRAQLSSASAKPARMPQIAAKRTDTLSVEDRLALDERGTECEAFGETMGSLTMPLRRELILMASVVC